MNSSKKQKALHAMHTDEAIQQRIASEKRASPLGDFILGAVDGTVTTFAIVAGAAGAGFSGAVAIVLGLANIVADSFSMAASNYLKAKSDQQILARFRRMEEMHIDKVPDYEREEIRQIFAAKGFDGDILEDVVRVITADRKRWVDTMLVEEWGLHLEQAPPLRAATATFFGFAVAGLIPLLPLFFVSALSTSRLVFLVSTILTGITFFVIGLIRGWASEQKPLRAAFETLAIGGAAAAMAYLVGGLFQEVSFD